MIEVIRDIDQLYVRKADKEQNRTKSVISPHGNGNGAGDHDSKGQVHPVSRQWVDPLKSIVTKMQDRFNQLCFHPTHGNIPQRTE